MSSSSTSTTWSTSARCAASTLEKSASPAGLKKQSTTRLPESAGRLIGRHSLPKADWIASRSPGRLQFSASILLMMTSRHSLRCAAQSIMREVIISMPAEALTTTAAVSTASSAPIACPMKSGNPGVSIMCTRVPAVSRCRTDARSECFQVLSSGSKSLTDVPRSTLPMAWIAPALCNSASTRVVLPDAPWPTSASVRMSLVGTLAIWVSSGLMEGILPCGGDHPAPRV